MGPVTFSVAGRNRFAAGVAIPAKNGDFPIRGVSLLAHLRLGGKTELPDRYLFWDLYGQVGVLHGQWKMVGEIPNHHGRFDQAVRNAQTTKFQLYDLKEDIGEAHDLSEKFPEIYGELKTRHLEWLKGFAK